MSQWSQKKTNLISEKKRTNWNQSLRSTSKTKKPKKLKKSLQYLLLLKKFNNLIDYKNIKLLKGFFKQIWKNSPTSKNKN